MADNETIKNLFYFAPTGGETPGRAQLRQFLNLCCWGGKKCCAWKKKKPRAEIALAFVVMWWITASNESQTLWTRDRRTDCINQRFIPLTREWRHSTNSTISQIMDYFPSSTSNRTEIIYLNIRIRSINNWQFERAPVYQQMNKFRRKQERSSLAHLETNKEFIEANKSRCVWVPGDNKCT